MNHQDDIMSAKATRKSLDSSSLHWKNDNHTVQGPDGNTILCDSPQSSHLPYYTGPDQSLASHSSTTTPGPTRSSEQHQQKETNLHDKRHNSETSQAPPPPSSPNTMNQQAAHRSIRRVKPRRVIGNYTFVSTLGKGSCGKVRLAVNELNQDKLAVKIVPRIGTQERLPNDDETAAKKKREKEQHREIRTIREASIMLLLHHPYIVSLKEMVVLDPYYYMFMEYVDGGQLLDFIISHGKLKERHARKFARQIVSALDYCHRNSIVHRDLKIENILISRNGHIKIIDFGLSNLFSPRSHLSTFCGSLYFAAPELLNAKAYTGPEVDVWSFGIVLYVLVCGKVPFDDQNMAALHDKIKRGVVDYPSHLSSDCKNILSRMLVVNPSHRATTAEITVHPWMNKGFSEPVDNYLPDRAPLTLPVDMQVVRGMTGFEFGSEQDIKNQLEDIIQSDEYQKAAATLMERQSQRHYTSTSHSRNHRSFILPNDDPQSIPAAYHPLISIYYLVKEHMERDERRSGDNKENTTHLSALPSPRRSLSPSSAHRPDPAPSLPPSTMVSSDAMVHRDPSSFVAHPSTIIPLPEAAHAAPSSTLQKDPKLVNESPMVDTTLSTGVAYGEKGKMHIQVDDDGQVTVEKGNHQQPAESYHGFGRLFNWHPSSTHHQRGGGSDDEQQPNNNSRHGLQHLTQAVTRSSTDKKNHRQRRHTSDERTMVPQGQANISDLLPLPSTSSGNGRRGGSTSAATPGLHRQQSKTSGHVPLTINTKTNGDDQPHDDSALSAGTKRLGRTFSKMLSRKTDPATPTDVLPCAQTDTSGSTCEDDDQKRIMDQRHRHGIGHRFTKSGRGHTTTAKTPGADEHHVHEQAFPTNVGGTLHQNQGTADEQVKPVFLKGLFSVSTTSTKHPSVIRADLIRVLERIGVKWRESKSRFECVHVPSIDMNRVMTTDQDKHLSVGEQSSLPQDSSSLSLSPPPIPTPAVTVPDLVVRFEIYIVKVPWLLGMHGLQFRRVSGDTWQYKNMCSRILAELKL